MTDEMVPGSPVLYPARLPGGIQVHLARTEARKGAAPALFAVCRGTRDELVRVPLPAGRLRAWWARRRLLWCPDCRDYSDYLGKSPQL